MNAVAHSPEFAEKVGVPVSVGREFSEADKRKALADGLKKPGKPAPKAPLPGGIRG